MFTVLAALDVSGDISLAIQIVILFLLVLGLPFVRTVRNKRNLMFHGYSTLLAIILHSISIFLVMIPSLLKGFGEVAELSILPSFTVWSHVVLGVAAWIFGAVLIAFWLVKGPANMTCNRLKPWMAPIFIVWIIAIVNGAIVHLFGLL